MCIFYSQKPLTASRRCGNSCACETTAGRRKPCRTSRICKASRLLMSEGRNLVIRMMNDRMNVPERRGTRVRDVNRDLSVLWFTEILCLVTEWGINELKDGSRKRACVKTLVLFEEVLCGERFEALVALEYFGALFGALFIVSVEGVLWRWNNVGCRRWCNRWLLLIKDIRAVWLLKWKHFRFDGALVNRLLVFEIVGYVDLLFVLIVKLHMSNTNVNPKRSFHLEMLGAQMTLKILYLRHFAWLRIFPLVIIVGRKVVNQAQMQVQ